MVAFILGLKQVHVIRTNNKNTLVTIRQRPVSLTFF